MKKLIALFLIAVFTNYAQAWKGWYRYVTQDKSTIITCEIISNQVIIKDADNIMHILEMHDPGRFINYKTFNEAGSALQTHEHGFMGKLHADKMDTRKIMENPYMMYQMKAVIKDSTSPQAFTITSDKGSSYTLYAIPRTNQTITIMGTSTEVSVLETGPWKKRNKKRWKYVNTYYFRISDGKMIRSTEISKQGIMETFLIKEDDNT